VAGKRQASAYAQPRDAQTYDGDFQTHTPAAARRRSGGFADGIGVALVQHR
jgi:hypothetical protein